MITLLTFQRLGRRFLSSFGFLVAIGILLSAWAQDAGLPEGPARIPIRKADQDAATPSPTEAQAKSMGESIIETVGQSRYELIGQQKEGVEFIWTPALLMQQVLREDVLISYPNE